MTDTLESTSLQASVRSHQRTGLLCGVGAYFWWGFLPLYLKAVAHIAPILVLAHRIVWSLVFVLILIGIRGSWSELTQAVRQRRTMIILTASTTFLAINWFVYIVAISTNRVVEGSLGYFINPLVNVLLGIIFLRERLRPWQAVGLVVAASGVFHLAWSSGQFPWIAVTLAITFGFYGLFRKIAPVGSITGLTVETAILVVPSLIVISIRHHDNQAGYELSTWLLLLLSGIVTAVPLLFFAAAARRLRLITMGFLQYIAPTCQFLLAVIVFHEPFTRSRVISFSLIWTALVIYSIDTYRAYRTGQQAPPQPVEEP